MLECYRSGQKIADVNQEVVVNVMNCSFVNSAPVITINGITGNSATVNAGDLVTFSVNANDGDLLQNGAGQSVNINASGEIW